MNNKRGISPIIATMLLVAFAVAVGASFVSFAGFYFETKSLNKTIGCKDYIIDFFELDRTKDFCILQFEVPFALKFEFGRKPSSTSNCYVSVASGTSKLCNAEPFVDKTWIPSENIKI